MTSYSVALVIDDLIAHRALAARILRAVGWTVYTASGIVEAEPLLIRMLAAPRANQSVVVTDLQLSQSPTGLLPHVSSGAQYALSLRTRMDAGTLPRVSILALTCLSDDEQLDALAFGCDAILRKPAGPDLAQRIQAALTAPVADDVALLQRVRHHLATLVHPPQHVITEEMVSTALRAYQRAGVAGLGESELATVLAAHESHPYQRGEQVFAKLVHVLEAIDELLFQLPAKRCMEQLGLSSATYYRYRATALHLLASVLTSGSTLALGM